MCRFISGFILIFVSPGLVLVLLAGLPSVEQWSPRLDKGGVAWPDRYYTTHGGLCQQLSALSVLCVPCHSCCFLAVSVSRTPLIWY